MLPWHTPTHPGDVDFQDPATEECLHILIDLPEAIVTVSNFNLFFNKLHNYAFVLLSIIIYPGLNSYDGPILYDMRYETIYAYCS